jgi:hypothetical protein
LLDNWITITCSIFVFLNILVLNTTSAYFEKETSFFEKSAQNTEFIWQVLDGIFWEPTIKKIFQHLKEEISTWTTTFKKHFLQLIWSEQLKERKKKPKKITNWSKMDKKSMSTVGFKPRTPQGTVIHCSSLRPSEVLRVWSSLLVLRIYVWFFVLLTKKVFIHPKL